MATKVRAKKSNTPPENMLPSQLHILPLTERPFFPPQTLPVLMSEEQWRDTIELVGETEHRLAGLLLADASHPDEVDENNFYRIGTVVRVHHPVISGGKVQFIAEGLQRFRVSKFETNGNGFMANVEYPIEPAYKNPEQLKAYAIAIINVIKEMAPLHPMYSDELKFFLTRFTPNEPSQLTDFAVTLTTAKKEELQHIVETVQLRDRMQKVLTLLRKELEVARIQSKIQEDVEKKLNEHQRKFFLREQLKVIQRELGIHKDDRTADLDRFRERLETLKPTDAASIRIEDEMDKLAVLEPGSPEYAVTRNWLDAVTSVPWGKLSKDNLDLKRARAVLEHEHAGLVDVKTRVIEFLAVGALKERIDGAIVLLIGPPGVGKTSIGKSIANALERKFFRFSVGGMRDEAEIKGHRRTYIGALPGKIVQALRDTQTMNPVIMLDEIDKMGQSFQGDPASALLEVLDPEQNHAFLDHYLDVRVDLSRVLFVCTANQLDTIPRPLLDRMEVVRLSGYITEEKVAIAKEYLWPRLLDKTGLKSKDIQLKPAALKRVIEEYAREAGVRNLEKQLGRIARKVVVNKVNGEKQKTIIEAKNVPDYLGLSVFAAETPSRGVGVVTGLAWTTMGGSTLDIETSLIHTLSRGLKLTGTLGDVMKESAEIAFSYLAAHYRQYGLSPELFEKGFVHIHVPEGATPKDGPSAGITLATALLSLALNKALRKRLAMTGELTLTGQVLAVGGIREKIVAARRSGVKEVIMPEACRGEFEELPDYIQKGLKVHFVKRFEEVAKITFGV